MLSFWIFILYGLKTHIVGHPASIKFGFSIGFALLLAFDYLYNYANQLMIDSNNKKFTEMNILSTNIVLDDKMFKLNKTQGLVIKNSIFERFKKEKKPGAIFAKKTYHPSIILSSSASKAKKAQNEVLEHRWLPS